MAADSAKSIQHLQAFPIMADTCDYIHNYYSWAKEKSRLVNFTCNVAENGIVKVASPIVRKFEPQVRAIDEAADKQLSRLESRFPSVQKPTKELWEDSWNYCDQTARAKVDAIKSPIVHQYDTVRATIALTKDISLNYAKQVVDTADHYVDTYLPSDDESCEEPRELSSFTNEDVTKEENVTARSKAVWNKTQRRLYRRGERTVAEVHEALENSIKNVLESVGLLETLQAAREGMVDLNMEFWHRLETLQENSNQDRDEFLPSDGSELTLSDSSSQHSSDSSNPATENRVMDLVMRSVQSTCQALTVLSEMVYYRLDDTNKSRWDITAHSIHDFYVRVKESPETLSRIYLSQIRELFHRVSESASVSIQNASEKIQTVKNQLYCSLEDDNLKSM